MFKIGDVIRISSLSRENYNQIGFIYNIGYFIDSPYYTVLFSDRSYRRYCGNELQPLRKYRKGNKKLK